MTARISTTPPSSQRPVPASAARSSRAGRLRAPAARRTLLGLGALTLLLGGLSWVTGGSDGLSSDGRVTGYSGGNGISTKLWLLEHEGVLLAA